MMELTRHKTISLTQGSMEAIGDDIDIPQDRQVNEIIVSKRTMKDNFTEASLGLIFGSFGTVFAVAMTGSGSDPWFIMAGCTGGSYSLALAVLHSAGKSKYLNETMNELGITGKDKRRSMAKKIAKIPKDQEVTVLSDPDAAGNIRIWKLRNNQLSLLGVRNAIDDWDHTVNNAVAVYDLQEHALELSL